MGTSLWDFMATYWLYFAFGTYAAVMLMKWVPFISHEERDFSFSIITNNSCYVNQAYYRETIPKVYDIMLFNGELDLLEIRLRLLNETVDKFILVESCITFSAKPKPYYYEENKERYSSYSNKYNILSMQLYYNRIMYVKLGKDLGSYPFEREHNSRDIYFIKALDEIGAKPDDLVIFGDLDEMPHRHIIQYLRDCNVKNYPVILGMHEYIYDFGCRDDDSYRLKVLRRRDLSSKCNSDGSPSHCPTTLRGGGMEKKYGRKVTYLKDSAYHFSYFMSLDEIIRKVGSYSHTDRDTPENRDKRQISCKICHCQHVNLWNIGTRKNEPNVLKDYDFLKEDPRFKKYFPTRKEIVDNICVPNTC